MATSRSRSKRPASKTSRTKRANQNPARQRGAARPATGAAGSVKRSKSSWPKAGKRPAPRALPPARVAAAVATMSAPSGTARFGAGKVLCGLNKRIATTLATFATEDDVSLAAALNAAGRC